MSGRNRQMGAGLAFYKWYQSTSSSLPYPGKIPAEVMATHAFIYMCVCLTKIAYKNFRPTQANCLSLGSSQLVYVHNIFLAHKLP